VTQYAPNSEDLKTAIFEQQMMGIAMKALHDYPIINEETTIYDPITAKEETVFVGTLKGTGSRLRIELLNIDQKDAMSYWGTSHAAPRLAAYYKVSVVLLKPETPPSRPGRVLSFGVNTFVGSGPRIDGCSNTLSFKIPGKTEMNEIELRPAQAPYDGLITFYGTGFSSGIVDMLLKNALWDKPKILDNNWQLKVTKEGITVLVQKEIGTIPVNPGIYSVCVRVTKQINLPDGTSREIKHLSNECPFMISPGIDNAADNIFEIPVTPDKTIIVEGHVFPPEETNEPLYPTLIIYIGSMKLKGKKSADLLSAGEFKVVKVATDYKIHLQIPDGLDPDITYFPLRIFVNGAESPPNWIKVK